VSTAKSHGLRRPSLLLILRSTPSKLHTLQSYHLELSRLLSRLSVLSSWVPAAEKMAPGPAAVALPAASAAAVGGVRQQYSMESQAPAVSKVDEVKIPLLTPYQLGPFKLSHRFGTCPSLPCWYSERKLLQKILFLSRIRPEATLQEFRGVNNVYRQMLVTSGVLHKQRFSLKSMKL
jgi:hypothetical protein